MPRARVAEVFAALSLTTDLATGVPFEKGLRTCVLATAFSADLGLAEADRAAVFHVALLRSIGCTAHAPENAALFHDDTAFATAFYRLDVGDPGVLAGQLADFGRWIPGRQEELARRFVAIAPVEGPRASCEVSRALGNRLGPRRSPSTLRRPRRHRQRSPGRRRGARLVRPARRGSVHRRGDPLWTFDDDGAVTRFRHYVDTAKHIAATRGEDTTVR